MGDRDMQAGYDESDAAQADRGDAGDGSKARVMFDDVQQRELQRIVAREVNAAKRRVQQEAEESRARQEAEAKGEYQKLLADAERERDDLRATMRRMEAERVVERVAKKNSAEHPDIIYRLIKDDLRYDDDGNATNVDELIAELRKDYPRYFVAPTAVGADAGKASPDSGGGDMNSVLRRAATKR